MKFDVSNCKGNSIFHFTKSDTAIYKILSKARLRLNDIGETNDPREYKRFGFAGKNRPDYIRNDKKLSIEFEKYSKIIRENCKVLCFSQDYFAENEWWDGYNLPRIWAQYGENHQGICLEIDLDEFKKENDSLINDINTHFKDILYSNKVHDPSINYPTIDYPRLLEVGISYFKELRKSYYKYFFYKKNLDWQTESEIRLLHFGKPDNDYYCSIKSSLKRIILGLEFDMGKLSVLETICGDIEICQLEFANNNLIPGKKISSNKTQYADTTI